MFARIRRQYRLAAFYKEIKDRSIIIGGHRLLA